MWMTELATKTKTADSRIGSQRAARETMCSLLRRKRDRLDFAGEATTVGRVWSRACDRGQLVGDLHNARICTPSSKDGVVEAFALEVGDVLHERHD